MTEEVGVGGCELNEKIPACFLRSSGDFAGGSDRRRSGDLSIFSRDLNADSEPVNPAEAKRQKELLDALGAIGVTLPCQRPVRMTGINPETGECRDVEMRCNTRKIEVCPSCAALYKGDINALMREGIHLAEDSGDAVVFLTMTAPSFGRTHYVPVPCPPRLSARRRAAWEAKNRRVCSCGRTHVQGDKRFQGLPVSTGGYDYLAQVRWNLAAGRLWSRTADQLTRLVNVRDETGKLQRLPYVAVAEWQARGAIHLHLIARVPRALVSSLEPSTADERGSGTVRLSLLERVAKTTTTEVDGETISWGRQCVAEVVNSEKSMVRTAGYLSKMVSYTTKSLGESGLGLGYSEELRMHHRRLNAAAARLHCGERPSRTPGVPLNDEQARWIKCENDQNSGRTDKRCGCRSLRHRQWGWRGHTVRKSRSWAELTITGCRRARRRFHDVEGMDAPAPAWEWSRPVDGSEMSYERYEWSRWKDILGAPYTPTTAKPLPEAGGSPDRVLMFE